MPIISDRRKNVSMEIRGKFGRNPDCVLALVMRTCKRLESRKGIAERSGETRARPLRRRESERDSCYLRGEFRRECGRYLAFIPRHFSGSTRSVHSGRM